MNLPIDPREGNRRQKALQARLAAMAQNQKAFVGKLGQARGQVRSMGAIGGARGARFPVNGMARPGALSFLQAPGFGMSPGDQGRGPEMRPSGPFGPPRRVSNPLPTQPLDYTVQPGTNPQLPNGAVADTTPGYGFPDGNVPVVNPNPPAGMSIWGDPLPPPGAEPPAQMAGVGSSGRNSGLIPLGNGQYFNPETGQIHGGGSGSANFKAL